MNLQSYPSRIYVCTLLVTLLLLPCPMKVNASWGLEVGRADSGDAAALASDWVAFKRTRNRIHDAALKHLPVERQRQLLGVAEADALGPVQMLQGVVNYWLREAGGPLQRIALNPAASCEEAKFAMAKMMEMKRQEQLFGIDEDPVIQRIHQATGEMAALRCREEALDECVATGRFAQIPELVVNAERQAQLFGGTTDLENWAIDALKQCAIYELHFVSKTKGGRAPMSVDTVRDGRVSIKFEAPPSGLMNALRGQLSELLKGETAGGNNPFFVSVKCTPPVPIVEVVCSPGADSTPIKAGINILDLKHKEFYVESEVSKQRIVGEDKLSFDFAGGMFSLQGLIKAPYSTASVPFPNWGNSFYMAHQKDAVDGPRSGKVRIVRNQRGVYPIIFRFTYEDQGIFGGATVTDSTEFELIHKPKPKPFPRSSPEPSRPPLRARPGE